MSEDNKEPEKTIKEKKDSDAVEPKNDSSTASESSDVEVLGKDDPSGLQEYSADPSSNKLAWLPWRRRARRDHQIAQLRDGYTELISLVRNINGHLDRQKDEASQVSGLVQSLPPVLASFEKLAESQEQGTVILGKIGTHLENSQIKDEQLLKNMEGMNTTMKDLGETNRGALGALERVQDKVSQSDERMSGLFDQATKNGDKVGNMMMRMEKRLFFSNLALIILLAALIIFGIYWSTRSAVESTLPASTNSTAATAEPTEVEAPAPIAEEIEEPANAETTSLESPELSELPVPETSEEIDASVPEIDSAETNIPQILEPELSEEE